MQYDVEYPPIKVINPIDNIYNIKLDISKFYFQLSRKDNNKDLFKLEQHLSHILSEIKRGIQEKNELYYNYLDIMFRLIAHTRDINSGKGERQLTYMMIWTWYKFYPVLAIYALDMIVSIIDDSSSYGSWKDIPCFCEYIRNRDGDSSPIIDSAIEIMNRQFIKDLTMVEYGNDKISNVGKWIPRERSRFGWLFDKMVVDWGYTMVPHILNSVNNHEQYSRALNKIKKMYRKNFVKLNILLNTIEVKQCSQKWSKISPLHINKCSWLKYKNAFMNPLFYSSSNTYEDRKTCADNLQYGKCSTESSSSHNIKSIDSTSVPISYYVQRAITLIQNGLVDLIEIHDLNDEWNILSNKMKFLVLPTIPMVDISWPMYQETSILYNAIGIGILLSEYSSLGRRIMFIDNIPKWVNLEDCVGFVDIVFKILGDTQFLSIGTNSNFVGGFSLILESIISTEMAKHDVEALLPVMISDFSSGEFNKDGKFHSLISELFFNASPYSESKSLINGGISQLSCVFETHKNLKPSFNTPKIIYWNLSNKMNYTYPVNFYEDTGFLLLSGTNASLFKIVAESIKNNSSIDSFMILKNILAHTRYSYMGDCLKKIMS
jgi:hypothetical protein